MLEDAGRFQMPEKSKALFDKYWDESDLTNQFINECLAEAEGSKTKFKSVYDEYKEWARDNGYKQCSRRTFKSNLEKYIKIDSYIGQDCVFDYELQREVQLPFG